MLSLFFKFVYFYKCSFFACLHSFALSSKNRCTKSVISLNSFLIILFSRKWQLKFSLNMYQIVCLKIYTFYFRIFSSSLIKGTFWREKRVSCPLRYQKKSKGMLILSGEGFNWQLPFTVSWMEQKHTLR